MEINCLSADLLGLVLSSICKSPILACVCRKWKQAISGQTYQRLWRNNFLMKTPWLDLVMVDGNQGMLTNSKIFYNGMFGRRAVKFNGIYMDGPSDWVDYYEVHKNGRKIREYSWSMNDDGVPRKTVFHDRRWTKTCEDDGTIVAKSVLRKIRFTWNYSQKHPVKSFDITLDDGKKVFRIVDGKAFKVKRKSVGILPGRSRMMKIDDQLKPVNYDHTKVPCTQVPEWLHDVEYLGIKNAIPSLHFTALEKLLQETPDKYYV